MTELSVSDLERETADLLPERSALGLFNWAGVVANNEAIAVNAVTLGSTAVAVANQGIWVFQH